MFKKLLLAAVAVFLANQTNASPMSDYMESLRVKYPDILINPQVGGTGSFAWEYLNPLNYFDSEAFIGNNLVLAPVNHNLIIALKIEDYAYVGDNFEKIFINGVLTPWDSYIPGTGSEDNGTYAIGEINLSLLAGNTYTISVQANPYPCNFRCSFGGGAYYSITPAPEPETYAMMLVGLGLVGAVTKRKRSV